MLSDPLIRFMSLIPNVRFPERADRSAGGTLPTRAFRYCEASTTASAFGWYVFPPVSFKLFWTGQEIYWTYAGAPSWEVLDSVQAPGFKAVFDAAAPPKVRGYSPPLLGALPEPGIVQVWSGLIAQTRPGVSLLLRPPVNLPRRVGHDVYEGLVETDKWFGPLFVNIRLSTMHTELTFSKHMPLFQAQPLQRACYADAELNNFVVDEIASLTATDWQAYHSTVVEPIAGRCPHGHHATKVRKRRRMELAARTLPIPVGTPDH